ncbi:MAG TPA: hypothetical protein DCZ55_33850 [Cyanobacteria bacterium UBA11371]|nr:hypothetical protein [Cyanobacteria bacterium UBA11371]HBE35513.1 hypothetical protein [Cyanobacteria bacterium UBA11368]
MPDAIARVISIGTKRQYDTQRLQKFVSSTCLPPGCKATMQPGTGILEILCESQQLVDYLWRTHESFLHLLTMERIVIRTQNGSDVEPAAVEKLLAAKQSRYQRGSSTMKNGQLSSVQDDIATLRILERIYTSDPKPISLVSLETHTNLYFNRALLSMLGVEPQKARSRNLKPYWLRPEEMRPDLPSDYIPMQLQEILDELRASSLLQNRRYTGWRENQYGIWTADIEAIQVQGEWARMMVTHDFEPAN